MTDLSKVCFLQASQLSACPPWCPDQPCPVRMLFVVQNFPRLAPSFMPLRGKISFNSPFLQNSGLSQDLLNLPPTPILDPKNDQKNK